MRHGDLVKSEPFPSARRAAGAPQPTAGASRALERAPHAALETAPTTAVNTGVSRTPHPPRMRRPRRGDPGGSSLGEHEESTTSGPSHWKCTASSAFVGVEATRKLFRASAEMTNFLSA
jgi:hypothetical protein